MNWISVVWAIFLWLVPALSALPLRAGEQDEVAPIRLKVRCRYQTDDAVDLGRPRKSVLDVRDRLFSLDIQLGHVHVWNQDGSYLQHFGEPGEGPGELALRAGMGDLCVFGEQVIIVDEQVGRIHFFDASTFAYLKTVPRPSNLARLYLFQFQDNLYALNLSSSKRLQELVRLDQNLNIAATLFSTPFDLYEWRDAENYIVRPYANLLLAATRGPELFLGQTNENEILVFDQSKQTGRFSVPILRDPVTEEDKAYQRHLMKSRGNRRVTLEFPEESVYYNSLIPVKDGLLAIKAFDDGNRLVGLALDEKNKPFCGFDTSIDRAAGFSAAESIGEVMFITGMKGGLMVVSIDEEGTYQIIQFEVELHRTRSYSL